MPVVTFLSDYGLDDDFVGVCHGVIARIALGNVVLDAEPADLAASGLASSEALVVNGVRAAHATTFADVRPGGLLLYADGYGALSLAINRGSALEALRLEIDAPVEIVAA